MKLLFLMDFWRQLLEMPMVQTNSGNTPLSWPQESPDIGRAYGTPDITLANNLLMIWGQRQSFWCLHYQHSCPSGTPDSSVSHCERENRSIWPIHFSYLVSPTYKTYKVNLFLSLSLFCYQPHDLQCLVETQKSLTW